MRAERGEESRGGRKRVQEGVRNVERLMRVETESGVCEYGGGLEQVWVVVNITRPSSSSKGTRGPGNVHKIKILFQVISSDWNCQIQVQISTAFNRRSPSLPASTQTVDSENECSSAEYPSQFRSEV